MPNLNFYASGADFDDVLTWVFGRSGCRVFESYSPFSEEIAEFRSIDELSRRYPVGACSGTAPSVLLQLVTVSAEKLFSVRRIKLSPEACDGHAFRYVIEGWGLIQLYLGGTGPLGLVWSHTNHNTEARARRWQDQCRGTLGSIEAWNWAEITAVSSALNRFIRKLATYKFDSRPVLHGAAVALAGGLDPVFARDKELLAARRIATMH